MKRLALVLAIVLAVSLLCGCGSLLERQYSVVQPHSQKYWEAGSSGVLRAEDYGEIVNGLLTLLGLSKTAVNRNREATYGNACRSLLKLGICSHVTDKDYLIKTCHFVPPFEI